MLWMHSFSNLLWHSLIFPSFHLFLLFIPACINFKLHLDQLIPFCFFAFNVLILKNKKTSWFWQGSGRDRRSNLNSLCTQTGSSAHWKLNSLHKPPNKNTTPSQGTSKITWYFFWAVLWWMIRTDHNIRFKQFKQDSLFCLRKKNEIQLQNVKSLFL